MKLNCKYKVIKLLILSTIAGIAFGQTPVRFDLYKNKEAGIDDRITITSDQDLSLELTIETNDDYTAEPDANPFLDIDNQIGGGLTFIHTNKTINDEMTWTFNKDVSLDFMYTSSRGNSNAAVGLEFTINSMTHAIAGGDFGTFYTHFSNEIKNTIINADTRITVKTIGDQADQWDPGYSIAFLHVMIVPEPGTYALILGGSVFLLFLSKRFRDLKRT